MDRTAEAAHTHENLVDDAEDTDPLVALPAVAALRDLLEDLEESAVVRARIEGMSWSRIGALLHRSKQAVWERHRDPQDPSPGRSPDG